MASLNLVTNDQLVDTFDRCIAMQVTQLACLKAGCLTEINQWLEERQTVIANLRETLAGVQVSALDMELRALLLEKLRNILSTEELLFTLAKQQRSSLSEKLTVIRRGKRTLGRYGSTSKNQPPQFVNNRG